MQRKRIRIGITGLGLMGREFASSIARWCHLPDTGAAWSHELFTAALESHKTGRKITLK